jgi:type I restriction enzyme S subunit
MSPEEFLVNFGVLADAPGGVKKLREMILELAVRGRLVEQHPDDEPAEVLLNRVTQERHLLITGRRVGGRGQDLPNEEIRDSSMPYAIPTNWKWCALADVAGHIVDGTHHTPKYVTADGISFISAKDIKNGKIIFDGCRMISRTEYEDLRKRCDPKLGDLLVTKSGSIGEVAIVRTKQQFTLFESVALIPIAPSIDREYASHVVSLGTSGDFGKEHQKGVAVRHLHLKDLRRLPFPLPPLMEQRRIAARVKQLMVLCDELETKQIKKQEAGALLAHAALHALTSAEGPAEFAAAWRRVADNFEVLLTRPESVRELRKAILELSVRGKLVGQTSKEEPAPILLKRIAAEKVRLIESGAIKPGKAREEDGAADAPFALPAGWAWSHIGEIFDVVGGIQKTPKRAPVKNHHPYLRVENVQRGRLDLSRIERFELVEGELERWRLAPDDLLIVEGNGSETEIGRCAVWNGEINDCVHQNHLIRCRPIKPGESAFTLLFLNSPSGMTEMKELAITTSGLYSLSVGKIRGIMIPVAPLAEQKRIIAKVNQLMTLCDELETKLRDAEKGAQRLAEAMTAAMVA